MYGVVLCFVLFQTVFGLIKHEFFYTNCPDGAANSRRETYYKDGFRSLFKNLRLTESPFNLENVLIQPQILILLIGSIHVMREV